MLYEDNPRANLAYLKTLTQAEVKYYVEGYLMACVHMKEAFSKGRYEILNDILGQEGSVKDELLRMVGLLDMYEGMVVEKQSMLAKLFPDIYKNNTDSP